MVGKVKSICIYYANIFIWLFLKVLSIKKATDNHDTILIIPPDSLTVWGSRGDEAMLEVVIDSYTKRGIHDFIIFVSSQAKKEMPPHECCRYYYKWFPHFSIFGFLKALNKFKPCEVVILGADCMDGYYSALGTLTRLMCGDLCYEYAVPYNIVGFSFNQNPNRLLWLPYKLVSKGVNFKLRDPISLKRFESFTNRKALQVADSAFLLKPDGKQNEIACIKDEITNLKKSKGKFVVGFNFHPMLLNNVSIDNINKTAVIISNLLIEILRKHHNISLVIIPHDNRSRVSDCYILGIIADHIYKNTAIDSQRVIYIDKVYHAKHIKYITSHMDMLICSRMHLAIAALGMGIPVMTANYQGKFIGLFELFHIPNKYILNLQEICSHTLVERFDEFYSEYKNILDIVKSNKEKVLELSSLNFRRE